MTGRINRTRISPYLEKNERTGPAMPGPLALMAAVEASIKKNGPRDYLPGAEFSLARAQRPAVAVLLDHHCLVEDQLAVLHQVATELVDGRIAVLVDRVGAEHALLALRLEHLLDDRRAVAALGTGALHRIEPEAHRLVAVDRVRLRRTPVLGLEVGEELLAFRRVALRVDRRDRDVGVRLGAGRQLARERGLCHAVGAEQLDVRVARVDVLVQLDAVRGRDAAEEEGVSTAGLDLLRERPVVRGLDVDAVVTDHLDAVQLR